MMADMAHNTQELAGKLRGVDAILLVDVSKSMNRRDAGIDGEQQRWDVLLTIIREVGQKMLHRLAVVAFNDEVWVVVNSIPQPDGMTDIARALKFLYPVAGLVRKTILISDGEPNIGHGDPCAAAIKAAREFGGKLDVVYIGPEGGDGRGVLQRIADAAGGGYYTQSLLKPNELTSLIIRLALPAPIAL